MSQPTVTLDYARRRRRLRWRWLVLAVLLAGLSVPAKRHLPRLWANARDRYAAWQYDRAFAAAEELAGKDGWLFRPSDPGSAEQANDLLRRLTARSDIRAMNDASQHVLFVVTVQEWGGRDVHIAALAPTGLRGYVFRAGNRRFAQGRQILGFTGNAPREVSPVDAVRAEPTGQEPAPIVTRVKVDGCENTLAWRWSTFGPRWTSNPVIAYAPWPESGWRTGSQWVTNRREVTYHDDTTAPRRLAASGDRIHAAAFTADGTLAVARVVVIAAEHPANRRAPALDLIDPAGARPRETVAMTLRLDPYEPFTFERGGMRLDFGGEFRKAIGVDSATGQLLSTPRADTLYKIDAQTWRHLESPAASAEGNTYARTISALALSPDLVAVCVLLESRVTLFERRSKRLLSRIDAGGTACAQLSISPDQRWVAIASVDGVRIADVRSGRVILILPLVGETVQSAIQWTADSRCGAAVTSSGALYWTTTPPLHAVRQLLNHGTLSTIALHPQGRGVAVSAWDRSELLYWDRLPKNLIADP